MLFFCLDCLTISNSKFSCEDIIFFWAVSGGTPLGPLFFSLLFFYLKKNSFSLSISFHDFPFFPLFFLFFIFYIFSFCFPQKKSFFLFHFVSLFFFLGCSKSLAALQDSLKKSAHSELALFALYWLVVTFPCGIVHILVMIRLRVVYGGWVESYLRTRIARLVPSMRRLTHLSAVLFSRLSSLFSLLSSLFSLLSSLFSLLSSLFSLLSSIFYLLSSFFFLFPFSFFLFYFVLFPFSFFLFPLTFFLFPFSFVLFPFSFSSYFFPFSFCFRSSHPCILHPTLPYPTLRYPEQPVACKYEQHIFRLPPDLAPVGRCTDHTQAT